MLRNILDLDPLQRAVPALRYAADQLHMAGSRAGPGITLPAFRPAVRENVIQAINAVQGFDKGPSRDARGIVDSYLPAAFDEQYNFNDPDVVEYFAYYLLAVVTAGYEGKNIGGTQIGNHGGDWRGGGFFDYSKSTRF